MMKMRMARKSKLKKMRGVVKLLVVVTQILNKVPLRRKLK
jgi:hypothetical protein